MIEKTRRGKGAVCQLYALCNVSMMVFQVTPRQWGPSLRLATGAIVQRGAAWNFPSSSQRKAEHGPTKHLLGVFV